MKFIDKIILEYLIFTSTKSVTAVGLAKLCEAYGFSYEDLHHCLNFLYTNDYVEFFLDDKGIVDGVKLIPNNDLLFFINKEVQ